MPKVSSGLVMYKLNPELKVFLVHPGGPFWKDKDEGAWSIPKGELENSDNILETAIREFKEETGIILPNKKEDYVYLGETTQKSGKVVHAYAFEGDWHGLLMCQSFVEIEYPYKSGKYIKIPEIDKANFFSVEEAKKKINPAQFKLIQNLSEKLI